MTDTAYRISVLTLGCRVNQYESDTLAAELRKLGCEIIKFGEPADAVILNTCTVTAESDRKSRQMIRRAGTFSKNVIVTGCYAQIEAEEAASLENVRFVCGNSDKANLPSVVMRILHGEMPTSPNAVTPPTSRCSVETVLTEPMRTRSYIKIEDGCENHCAYCLIRRARGPVRSKSPDVVLEEIKNLSTATHEVILTGIETASYGMDFPVRRPYGHALADLISDVATIPTVERIGLGSLEPTVMSEYFVDRVKSCSKLLPHFHLSVQSGSSAVLASMRRKYNREMALDAVMRMKKALPDVTFSCDVIVGFPGETEEDFRNTVEFCRAVRFLHLHIFPYSKRKGTEAAEMPDQVDEHTKHLRAAELERVGQEIKNELLSDYVNDHGDAKKPVYVLIEKNHGGMASGHSEHFAEVRIKDCHAKIGEIVAVTLDSHDGQFCYGRKA